MYEHNLLLCTDGIHSVDIQIHPDATPHNQTDQHGRVPDAALSVTVRFAITTDQRGSITVSGDGSLGIAMGGLGVSDDEARQYCLAAIRVFEAIAKRSSPPYSTHLDELCAAAHPSEIPDQAITITRSDLNV